MSSVSLTGSYTDDKHLIDDDGRDSTPPKTNPVSSQGAIWTQPDRIQS